MGSVGARGADAPAPGQRFAQALLRLRAAWEEHPGRRSLPPLLETSFATLKKDDREALADGFTDALLRLELARSLGELGELGLSQLAAELAARGIRRVALVPYGRLALFPLPAVAIADPATGRPVRLGERFEVTIAPSAGAFAVAQARARAADQARRASPPPSAPSPRPAVLAVGNPLPLPWGKKSNGAYVGSLKYAAAEADSAERIASAFGYPKGELLIYRERQATRAHVLAGLARAWYAHFATHGQFDPAEPRRSQLVLSGDDGVPEAERTISLGECLDGIVRLAGLRLLVLSACETSLIEARRAANEVIGLPAAFLQAGAAGVIAALWPVYDQATFLLMTRFLQLYLDPARDWSPARCLAEAQRWLREEATNAVIAEYQPNQPVETTEDEEPAPATAAAGASAHDEEATPASEREPVLAVAGGARRSLHSKRLSQETALWEERIAALAREDPNGLPYADPIYWAAFTVTGA